MKKSGEGLLSKYRLCSHGFTNSTTSILLVCFHRLVDSLQKSSEISQSTSVTHARSKNTQRGILETLLSGVAMTGWRTPPFFVAHSNKFPRYIVLAAGGILSITSFSHGQGSKTAKAPAQKKDPVHRLQPSEITALPPDFVEKLNARNCSIPQFDSGANADASTEPTNAIHGEFARKGQEDWAVLCSNGRNSTIVIFWQKPTACAASLARLDDTHYLKPVKNKALRYSRSIRTFGENDLDNRAGIAGLRPMAHDGIDDRFVGKSSSYFYCNQGKWKIFPGKAAAAALPAEAGKASGKE